MYTTLKITKNLNLKPIFADSSFIPLSSSVHWKRQLQEKLLGNFIYTQRILSYPQILLVNQQSNWFFYINTEVLAVLGKLKSKDPKGQSIFNKFYENREMDQNL